MKSSLRHMAGASLRQRSIVLRCAGNRRLGRWVLLMGIALLIAAHVRLPGAVAQGEPQAAPPQTPQKTAEPSASASRDPVLNDDGTLEARSVQSWREGTTRWVLLNQDVRFSIGTYGFRGDRALVRIEPQRLTGQTIQHLAVYLDNAQSLAGRSRVETEAPRLLVTVSTRGKIELSTDLLTPVERAPADAFVEDGLGRIRQYLETASQEMQPLAPGPQLFGPEAEADRAARREEIERMKRELRNQGGESSPAPGPQPAGEKDAAIPPPVGPTIIEAPIDERPAAPAPLPPQVLPPPEAVVDPELVTPPLSLPPVDPEVAEKLEDQRIVPGRGIVSFIYDRIESEPIDAHTRYVALMGNVQVMYQEFDTGRTMTLTADNAVIFVAVGRSEDLLDGRTLGAESILGIYLEDNVIVSDGLSTVRAPRVYIDPVQNRALVLDAVVYTIDVRRHIPLYMRAEQLRQESRSSWSGRHVTLTTSEFAQPHFSIASGRLSFEQTTDEATGEVSQRYDARNNVFNAGPVPVFFWPMLAGDVNDTPPIERIRAGYRENDGHMEPELQTRWNLFSLAGYPAPPGVALSGDLDYRGDHGLALGTDLRYEVPDMFGRTHGYFLPYDTGTDRVSGRDDITFEGETRGFVQAEHRQYLRHDLELSLQLGYVSDETFLEEFFPREAYTARPYETSAYLKQQQDDRAFTLLAKYNINNFLPQLTELQTPGYFVEKMPELGYRRIGTSLFGDRLTYFTENRLSRMRINPGSDTPADRGFGPFLSGALFGMPAAATFEEAAAMRSIPSDYRLRFDSRHEVQAPAKVGIVDVVPYVAGRITAYDDDFSDYRGEDENMRLWGTVGTRFHTQFSQSYNVENRLFDLHRLRHIIEPSANIFLIASTINSEDLPVYDPDVEALQKGFGTRIGVRNTLQTQRGGVTGSTEGWRSVDWLVIDTNYVHRSDDADVTTEIARFYDYRPEYSVGGDHLQNDVRWAVTDTFAIVSDVTYSLEKDNIPLWHVGGLVQHTPRFSTSIEYAEIELIDSRLLTWGANYMLTPKYNFGYRQRWNLGKGETQDLTVTLERRLPQWRVQIIFRHDAIEDEQTVGVALVPELFGGGGTPIFGP